MTKTAKQVSNLLLLLYAYMAW